MVGDLALQPKIRVRAVKTSINVVRMVHDAMIPVLIELAVRQRVAWGVISGVYQMAVPVDVVEHLRLIRLFMPLSSHDGIAVFAIKI